MQSQASEIGSEQKEKGTTAQPIPRAITEQELIAEREIAIKGGLREEEVILYRAGKMEEMKRRRQLFRVGQGVLTGNEEATSAHR